jgi:hypothetical protein
MIIYSKEVTGYDNFQNLSLTHYFSMADQELLFIQQKFTKLNSFSIQGVVGASRPLPTISAAAFTSCLEFVMKIESPYLSIDGNTGEDWILDKLCTSWGQDNRKLRFYIEIDNQSLSTGLNLMLLSIHQVKKVSP